MNLPDDAIQEFKKVHSKRYGEELSDKEAEQKSLEFFEFYQFVIGVDDD